MSQLPSKTYTTALAPLSDGVSLMNCIEPLIPYQLTDRILVTEAGGGSAFGWVSSDQQVTSSELHTWAFVPGHTLQSIPEATAKRLACLVLLGRLNVAGLSEAFDFLTDAYTWQCQPAEAAEVLPQPSFAPACLHQSVEQSDFVFDSF
jgi:hypothetical protein